MVGIASLGNGSDTSFGVAFRSDHTASHLRGHVYPAGFSLLVPSKHCAADVDDHRHFYHSDVLRRRLRHDARIHGGLFRTEERWANLWVNADCVEFCQRFRAALHRAHMRETTGNYAGALHVIAIVMFVSILLPIIVKPPRRERSM